jgi:hypothetical protein
MRSRASTKTTAPVDNVAVPDEEPKPPEYPEHTAEFDQIIKSGYVAETNVKSYRDLVDALMKVRDDELVMLGQVRAMSHVSIWPEALAAEVARRSTVALVEFKRESATASRRRRTSPPGWPGSPSPLLRSRLCWRSSRASLPGTTSRADGHVRLAG